MTVNFRERRKRLGAIIFGLAVLAGAIYVAWPLPDDALSDDAILSTRIEDREGRLLREVRPEGRGIPVTLEAVPQHAIDALIATEDRHFYRHFGVNPLAIARAAWDNLEEGEVVSGASTLTMQLARLLRGPSRRNLGSKIAEAMLALRLEVHFSKDEILNGWLNRAYFGNQAYGIEAASQVYFGKNAIDLTVAEAAYLIGLPQNPAGYNPYKFPDLAKRRFMRVLRAMMEESHLDQTEAERLYTLPIDLRPRIETFAAPHFVERIRNQLGENFAAIGTVRTTLDLPLQLELEGLAQSHLNRLGSEYVTNAAAIVLDNETGDILAYLGSIDFWNERIGGQNDGVQMLRQPGSALKPFTYAMALASRRYTAASILPDIELQIPEAGGAFAPQNYDKTYHGPVPLREALACSYNIPAIRVARKLTAPALLEGLRGAGFASLDRSPEHYGVGLTLGNGEVQLMELAQAYAALARMGQSLSPRSILSMISMDGVFIRPSTQSPSDQIFSPDIAYLITDILKDPEAREPAFGRHGPLELPFPTAVKTGTSKDYRDNWTIGYTPRHTVAVWVGNFDGAPMQRVSGVSGAGPLFKSIMLHLGEAGNFEQPETLETHEICPLSGHRPTAICPHRKRELFLPGTAPTDICSVHQNVVIDKKTQGLADEDTPANRMEHVVHAIHPEIYHNWMRDNNLPFLIKLAKESSITPQISITYPVDGMLFHLDPVLRPEFQKIRLTGFYDAGLKDVEWLVNKEPFSTSFTNTYWPLNPGQTTFQIQARAVDGTVIRSRPVSIEVIEGK